MEKTLINKNIAVLVENGFEEVEFTAPINALKEAGAKIFVISSDKKVKAWDKTQWGNEYAVDILIDQVNPDTFHALLLPGGVLNADTLRMNKKAIEFVKWFVINKMPIAAICHGPQVLLETGLMDGRKMTSFPSIKSDIKNAGAFYTDQEVVTDKGMVTSRKPEDIPAFNRKMVEEFAEGPHVSDKERGPLRKEKEVPTYGTNNRLNENIDDRNWGSSSKSDFE